MRKLSAALILASVVGFAGPAIADTQNTILPPGWGHLSATLGATTDYRFRGISQTGSDPALQGSIDWAHDNGLYLGVWGSNVDLPDAHAEIDTYGGYTFSSNGYNFDLGGIYYWYPGSADSLDYDYFEVKAAANRDFGFANATLGLNYSPDYFGGSGDATYASTAVDVPVMDTGFTVKGTAGYQWIDDEAKFGTGDYADWSLGVGYTLYGFDLALKYQDTNISKNDCDDDCDATAIFSVSRSFN